MPNIIVAGGREFKDYQLMVRKLDAILCNLTDITIVSGRQRGADQLGERYARERGYPIDPHPAQWTRYGNAAGPIRNREMAEVADYVIIFWNGVSDGSKSMKEIAEEKGLPLRIIYY